MEKGDIVSVVTLNGEFVGKVDSVEPLTLADPRMIVTNPDNSSMGFAKGVAMTGVENPDTMTFDTFTFVTPTNDKVAEGWTQATSSIVAPKPKKVIVNK
tara:strand:+ start:2694 stop:2990 length:297 start_codon:yes stop_codon:yes gene_type:complete